MKQLFFIAVAGTIFLGASLSVKSQSNNNTERSGDRLQHKASIKFIEDIEIVPAGASVISEPAEQIELPGSLTAVIPSVHKSYFAGTIERCSALQFKYGMMMDTEVESITNLPLYSFIDSWWATRYQYGGTDRSGIDCSAFTWKLLSEVYGLNVPRTVKDQYKMCEKMSVEELAEGDLVFFDTRGGVSHVGLYLGNNYFVHSSVSGGVTISSLADEYYSKRFVSGGRLLPAPAMAAKQAL